MTGSLDLGNVSGVDLHGSASQVKIRNLQGDLVQKGPGNLQLLALAATKDAVVEEQDDLVGNVKKVVLGKAGGTNTYKFKRINVTGDLEIEVHGNLEVGSLRADNIKEISATGNVKLGGITAGGIEGVRNPDRTIRGVGIKVKGDLEVSYRITVSGDIGTIEVGGTLETQKIVADGNIENLSVEQDLRTRIDILGALQQVSVGGSFRLPNNDVGRDLIEAALIGDLQVKGSLGNPNALPGVNSERITVGGIRSLKVGPDEGAGGNIFADVFTRSDGIGVIEAKGNIKSTIVTRAGTIGLVRAKSLDGTLRARRGSANAGGNIGRVELQVGGGEIHADNYIGQVIFVGNKSARVRIIAQAGAQFDQDIQVIKVAGVVQRDALKVRTEAEFAGQVRFAFGTAPAAFRVAFGPNEPAPLFQIQGSTDAQPKKWFVRRSAGNADSVNIVNATFKFDASIQFNPTKPLTQRFVLEGTPTFSVPGWIIV